MLLSGGLFGQQSPVLRCISLDDNNDVTLYWEQPADTGIDFNAYLVYYSAGATANFNILSTVTDFNQTSVLEVGSFAGAGRFFIVHVYNGFADTSLAVDTISPLVLGISSQGKNVSVGWNPTGLPSSDSTYRVYKLDSAGNFVPFKSLDFPLTAFSDTTISCSETVKYRVEVNGIGGCVSRSNVAEKLVIDEQVPNSTNLSFASVDTATGFVNLGWKPSSSRDTYGYTIYYFGQFNWDETYFDVENLSFTYVDQGIDANSRPETLSVAPFDSCFNATLGWYNQAPDDLRFVTTFIDTSNYDRCAGKVSISWNTPTEGRPVGVENPSGVRIYRSTNNEASEVIAVVEPEDSVFVDSTLLTGNKYTYVVAPFDLQLGVEALSNKLTLDLAQKSEPDYLYIKSIKNNHETALNEVFVLADSSAETIRYGLERALNGDENYMKVEMIENPESSEFFIEDKSGLASQTAYNYRVLAYDKCNQVIGVSQVAKSILLNCDRNVADLINYLSWDEYVGFDTAETEVGIYELLRNSGDIAGELLVAGNNSFQYTDDVSKLPLADGELCYYVVASESEENVFGFSDYAVSNLRCINFPPTVFVPDAFTPNDDFRNDVFLPYVNFIDPENYTLRIFDRAGNLVYTTNDPLKGWNGVGSPGGVYAYHLALTNALGEAMEYTGKIHLIR